MDKRLLENKRWRDNIQADVHTTEMIVAEKIQEVLQFRLFIAFVFFFFFCGNPSHIIH